MIHAIGIDAAFANMGLARVTIDPKTGLIVAVQKLKLIVTEGEDHKQVRKSSDSLRRAKMLYDGMVSFIKEGPTQLAFAEVPSGSQSAQAARALGIAVGVLSACPVPIIEVSPMEVKRLFSDKRKVPKTEIMAWGYRSWPKADWIEHRGSKTLANEHLADALATIVAGIKTPAFQQAAALMGEASYQVVPKSTRRALL